MTDELKNALISFKSSILGRDIRAAMYRAFTLVDEERNKDEGSIYKYLLFKDRIAKEYAKMVSGMEAVLPDDLKAAVHEQEWYEQLMETIAENDIDAAVSDALRSLGVSVPDYLPDSEYIQPLLDAVNSLHKVWTTTHEWHSVSGRGTISTAHEGAYVERYDERNLISYYIGDASEVSVTFSFRSAPAICISSQLPRSTDYTSLQFSTKPGITALEFTDALETLVPETLYTDVTRTYPTNEKTITVSKETLDAGNVSYLILGQAPGLPNGAHIDNFMDATITITHDNFIKRGGA